MIVATAMPPDIPAYLRRISCDGPLAPTLETLRVLHLAHATHIPFENIDCLLGPPIRLDLPSLEAKLVGARRGGYCHEQNTLFAAVLEALGFGVTRLAARVQVGGIVRPHTHMLLLVETAAGPHIADVGFGLEGLLHPIALRDGEVSEQFVWRYRLLRHGDGWVLQSGLSGDWLNLYTFTLQRQEMVDYEMSTWYTSTNPNSPFSKNLIVQQPGPERCLRLYNRVFSEVTPAGATQTTLADDAAVLDVLARRFGLHLPAETRFPAG